MQAKVIVIVSGGNVQDCYADSANIEVEVIDFDNIGDENGGALDRAEARVRKLENEMHHVY